MVPIVSPLRVIVRFSGDAFMMCPRRVRLGEQLAAVPPWRGAIYPPTDAPAMDATPPPESLRLSWVYGFRGYDTRRTALWSSADDGFVVYTAAALVVRYNCDKHAQACNHG